MSKKAATATKPLPTMETHDAPINLKTKGRPKLEGQAKIDDDERRDWVDAFLKENPEAKPKDVETAMTGTTRFENDKGDQGWYQFVASRKTALKKKTGGNGSSAKVIPGPGGTMMTLAEAEQLVEELKLDVAQIVLLIDKVKKMDPQSAKAALEKYEQFVAKAGSPAKAKELIALL